MNRMRCQNGTGSVNSNCHCPVHKAQAMHPSFYDLYIPHCGALEPRTGAPAGIARVGQENNQLAYSEVRGLEKEE